jgi:DNA-binding HxlR family transcriptional regulator
VNDESVPAPAVMPTVFIGKWTVKIMHLLKERPHRHGELRRHLGNISQRMLTKTLRNLESGGLITRRVTRSKPLAVEYSLTKLGRAFLAPLGGICRWANRYSKDISAMIQLSEINEDPPPEAPK